MLLEWRNLIKKIFFLDNHASISNETLGFSYF
ncbi:hypothetical protein T11_11483 [Trichinella zimbabwensis]|uniref:Uncharacterized protein n=1 Tax=Trichinella zimbabwensis TaxID=268475 RepID=A0A0V1F672_9BILA|nr:hypothetical protein T11_11483 [Trichinella zimbabwensis]